MGRPSSRRVISEGPWYRETQASPHHGNRPQNAIACMKEEHNGWDSDRVVPTLRPSSLTRTKRDSKTDKTEHTPYHTISQSKERSIADTLRTPKRARDGYRGPPRGGGRTQAPNPAPKSHASLSVSKSQIAIAGIGLARARS